MPKSSRDVGRTPWDAPLVSGTEAVSPEDTGSFAARSDTAHILKVEGLDLKIAVEAVEELTKEGKLEERIKKEVIKNE